MILHPLTPDSLEERNRRGILFRRLPSCWCGAPNYLDMQSDPDDARRESRRLFGEPPIRFVASRPTWRAL